jgi:hypothetical protein
LVGYAGSYISNDKGNAAANHVIARVARVARIARTLQRALDPPYRPVASLRLQRTSLKSLAKESLGRLLEKRGKKNKRDGLYSLNHK